GCDGEGNTWRLNSDAVAVEVARALEAGKLVYLTPAEGVTGRRGDEPPELLRHLTVEEPEEILRDQRAEVAGGRVPTLAHAVRAPRNGVPWVHIIDGRVPEGLLAEVFANEGAGTLVHTNEYQAIRRARRKDARAILALIQSGVESDELVHRSLT